MAIYHLHVKVFQRRKGDNVIGASAYRRAAKLYDQKEEKHWDYTNKPHVIYSEILVPANSPDWVKALIELHQHDPSAAAEQLWNRMEAMENRIDSQLGREIEFALPIELNEMQNIQLAREFIQDQFVSKGMIADWSVHWDKGNPHVHVLLTMRSLTESGFGQRVVAWNSKVLLQTWREKWAEYANFHLHLHQHAVKIDHRSYEAQGIDLIPGIHEGKAAREMARRGIGIQRLEDAAHIRRLNLGRLSENAEIVFRHLSTLSDTFTDRDIAQVFGRYVQPKRRRPQGFSPSPSSSQKTSKKMDEGSSPPHSAFASVSPDTLSLEPVVEKVSVLTPDMIEKILQAISQHESVFSEKDIAKAVEPFIEQADDFAKAVMAVKQSPAVMALGVGDDGRDKFTTRRLFDIENDIQELADVLRERVHLKISERQQKIRLAKHEAQTGKKLTDEQKAAVLHVVKPDAIACLVGRAGTGKSFSLGAAKAVWEAEGVKVHGIALSGIAADGLSKDVGILSSTIESFRYRVKKGFLTINPLDVIVMDEAGMTDSVSMQAVLRIAEQAKAKLVLVGDPAQLQPVGPGASFRALLERLGFAEIQTVYRQTVPWQREATVNFSQGEMAEGLAAYQKAGCIHLEATPEDAIKKLITHWKTICYEQKVPLHKLLVITHRNEDVDVLNQRFRSEQIKAGHLAEGYRVKTRQGVIKIALGDRILFLKNDNQVGVKNGRFATVEFVDFVESGNVINFTAKLDGSGNVVTINPYNYPNFTYGYAATVHKIQGATADACLVYAGGKGWNRELTYVALTRHRQNCHLYADQKTYADDQKLVRRLSRWGLKDSVLDFPLAFAKRRGIDPEKLTPHLHKNLSARLAFWKKRLAEQIERWLRPDEHLVRQAENAKQKQDAESITKRREDARVVASYVDARRDVGMSWQALQAKLTALGLSKKLPYQEKDAFDVIQGTAEYIAFQTAQRLRDQKAYAILQAPHRYEKALEIHDVDHEQLEKHAARHRCYENVQQYKLRLQSGFFGVYCDRFALAIVKNFKGHYPHLQDAGLHTSEDRRQLRTHSLSYLRRQCFLTLTAHEKEGFELVEAYLAAAKQAGDWWLKEIKEEKSKAAKKPTPEALKRLEALGQFRDTLAHAVLKQVDDCQKALDFYQVGVAIPQFGAPPSREQYRYAQKRWYQLQQQAAYHAARERVAANPKACETHDRRVSPYFQRIDTQRLRTALNDRAESVATHYLGQPKIKQGHTWRYGSNKGSLVVTVQGAKQGLWRDFQLDKGGDMLGLIQHALETSDFKAVLQEATRFLGGDAFYQTTTLTKPVPLTQKIVDRDADTKERIQKAQAIYRGTQAIHGTVAERYLREHRGILGDLGDKTFRYHPHLRNWMTRSVHPALVVVARDKTDEVCGIQAIFLDKKTAKKATQLDHQVKLSRGLIGEGAVVHTGKPDGKIALAEGIETALSIAEAKPDWTVVVTFGVGNFAKVRLPEGAKSVMICADNDGRDSATHKSVAKSAEKLAQRGVDVWVAEPKKPNDKTQWDFNDALLAGGVSQVKHDLDQAALYQKGISKEHVKADLEKTLAVSDEPISVLKTTTVNKNLLTTEIQNESIKTLLMRYVDMELEKTRLVNAMHSTRLQDPKAGKVAALEALAHASTIQSFAEKAIQHPEIKSILETKQKIKSPHLVDRGGFIGIRERLQQGECSEEDIHVLAKKLRNKVASEARVQVRERNHSGRCR